MQSSKQLKKIIPGIYVLPRPTLSFIKGACLYFIIAKLYLSLFWARIIYNIGLLLDKKTILGFNLASQYMGYQWVYHMLWLATIIISATFYSKRSSYSLGKIYGLHKRLLDYRLLFLVYFGFVIFLLPVLAVVIISLFDWPNFFTTGLLAASYQQQHEPLVTLGDHIFLLLLVAVFYFMALHQISDDGPGRCRSLIILIRCHIWKISLKDQHMIDDEDVNNLDSRKT